MDFCKICGKPHLWWPRKQASVVIRSINKYFRIWHLVQVMNQKCCFEPMRCISSERTYVEAQLKKYKKIYFLTN